MRLSFTLSGPEVETLYDLATRERRPPRDQAALLLSEALARTRRRRDREAAQRRAENEMEVRYAAAS
jgi:hypothetical protein